MDQTALPIVLVPGLLCSAEIFQPQATALWPHGPVMIASTLSGGTIAEMAAQILATAPPRFALAGISMGGYICFEIMRQAPKRVIKLALLDTSARADTTEQTEARRAMVESARHADFEAWVRNNLVAILHPSRQADSVLNDLNARMALTIGFAGFERQQEAIIARTDSRSILPSVKVPTLVLVGDGDVLTPPERAQEIAALIPGSELVVIPDCGHASTIERPDLVSAALVQWIAR